MKHELEKQTQFSFSRVLGVKKIQSGLERGGSCKLRQYLSGRVCCLWSDWELNVKTEVFVRNVLMFACASLYFQILQCYPNY